MFNNYGYPPIPRGGGLLSGGLFRGINFANILSNTQKTLGVINQAIPLCYQIKPMMNNAKTMFKIIGAVKGDDSSKETKEESLKNDSIKSNNYSNDNLPMFYI